MVTGEGRAVRTPDPDTRPSMIRATDAMRKVHIASVSRDRVSVEWEGARLRHPGFAERRRPAVRAERTFR